MKKRIFLLLLAVICLLVLAGCECEHEWSEPDCVNPERCTKCGEYGGAPLGHTWVDPTCEEPAICSVCGKTDAEPLGHRAGEWVEKLDVTTLTIIKEQTCTRCDEVLDSTKEQLTSLVQDSLYLFTPEEFITIINGVYEELDSDLRAEMTVEENGALNGIISRDGEMFGELTFAAYNGVMTESRAAERSVAQITVTFAHANLNNGVESVVNLPEKEVVEDAVLPVIMACMPKFSEEDAQEMVSFIYDGMLSQPEGSVKSFDHDEDGMTYFITDELLHTVFGLLPSVAWNNE